MRFRNPSNERIRVAGARMNAEDCCCEIPCEDLQDYALANGLYVTLPSLSVASGSPSCGCICDDFAGTYSLDYSSTINRWTYPTYPGTLGISCSSCTAVRIAVFFDCTRITVAVTSTAFRVQWGKSVGDGLPTSGTVPYDNGYSEVTMEFPCTGDDATYSFG